MPALAERVTRRIERVSSHAPALGRAMAVLGDGGSLGLAADLARLEESAAAEIARELVRIEVLADDDPFAFVHPLVRRSVYDGLAVTERDAVHAEAARLLGKAGAPREAVAAHLAALRPAGSAEVASALLAAAEAAVARAASDAAIRLLRRALEEGADEPSRSALLFELGKVEMALRDPAAFASLQQALDLAQEPDTRARIAATLAELLGHAGQWEAAIALTKTIRGELGDEGEAVVEVEALSAVLMAYEPRLAATFDRERPRLEELAGGDSWPARAICTLLGTVGAFRGEDPARAAAFIRRGLADGLLISERGAGGWAAPQALSGLVYLDDYDGALALAGDVAREGGRQGALLGLIAGPGYRSHVATRRGALAEAEAELRTVLDLAVQTGMSMWLLTGFFMVSDALLERPAMDDVAALVETTQVEDAFLDSASGAMLLEVRGRLRLARNDRERAIADLRRCAKINRTLRAGPTYSSWRSTLALALPAGEREEARALTDEEVELARATSLPRPQGVALRAAGLLDNGERGIDLLQESVSCLERSECRLEHARSLVDLGATLRRRQRRAESREYLFAGLEMAHRCGATRLTARAEEELRGAGARPRRVAQSGADALTASELRVARLAADGRSNTETAQELFVSVKTVETHLSHAYSKLGLSGQGARAGLAEALDRRPARRRSDT